MKISLAKGGMLQHIITLMGGTFIAQLIPILLSPWLSRIYSPEDFASMALILPIISVGSIISTLKLDTAIVIPGNEKEALKLMASAFITNITATLISVLAIFIFTHVSSVNYFGQLNKEIFWVIPFGIMGVGSYQILNFWSTRCRTFRNNAISKIIQSLSTLFISIALGYLLHGADGLIIGFAAGYFFGSFVLLYRLRGVVSKTLLSEYKKTDMRFIMKKYKNFILITTPHAILDIIVDQGLIYLMKVYFTDRILGGFAFAYRYTRGPLSIITSSIYQVFFQRASTLASEGKDVRPLMFKIQKNLFLLGIVPFVVMMIFAPNIFAFVFSESYREAGEIVRYLLPFIFMNFLVTPISGITLIYKKQSQALFITIIDFSMRVIAILLGGIFFDFRISFILISVFCTIILIFATLWYYKIAKPGQNTTY